MKMYGVSDNILVVSWFITFVSQYFMVSLGGTLGSTLGRTSGHWLEPGSGTPSGQSGSTLGRTS